MFNIRPVLALVWILGVFGQLCFCETLKDALDQKTAFIPQAHRPEEQLIEISQKFGIPMAIEWVVDPSADAKDSLHFHEGTVLQLIRSVVAQSSDHQVEIGNDEIHVFSRAAVLSPLNFLNLRIQSYDVKNESLLGAEALLRTKINMLLYPGKYRLGFGGGYGSAPDDPFWARNVTISGANLTIREILTRIARANANSSWIVTFSHAELTGSKPAWEGVPPDNAGHSPLNHRWKFVELGWGEAVEGVQCRLRLADNSTGAVPLLLFDVRNNGNRDFLVWQTPECSFAVRVDDQWYRSKFCDAKSSWFPPGRSYTGIALDLTKLNWEIDFKPGVHVIQIAVSTMVTPPSTGNGVTALSKVLSVTVPKREE